MFEFRSFFTVSLFIGLVTNECLDGWLRHEDYCYFFSRDGLNWFEALDFCKTEGGSLAEPRTNSIENFILRHITNRNLQYHTHTIHSRILLDGQFNWHPSTTSIPAYEYWLGAADIYQEGKWIWMSDHTPVVNSRWMPNEPNNYPSLEDCLVFNFKHSHQWNDYSCSLIRKFICQTSFNHTDERWILVTDAPHFLSPRRKWIQ